MESYPCCICNIVFNSEAASMKHIEIDHADFQENLKKVAEADNPSVKALLEIQESLLAKKPKGKTRIFFLI